MKNILLFNSKKFEMRPEIYFKELALAIENIKNDNFKIFSCNEDNYEEVINNQKFDIVILIRCYGRSLIEKYFKNKDIMKIVQMDDLHYFNNETKDSLHKSFDFANVILLPYYHHFFMIKEYKKYYNKAAYFPFAVTDKIKEIENKNKNNKILLSGAISNFYSLRKFIFNLDKENYNIEVLNHPGYDKLLHDLIGMNYYNYISGYLAAIGTSADKPLDYPVMKYFEIPGSGTIPLFEKISYLKDLGFFENENYIEVNKKNYKKVINIENLIDKQIISTNSKNLILKNHLISNRINLLSQMFIKGMGINWELK